MIRVFQWSFNRFSIGFNEWSDKTDLELKFFRRDTGNKDSSANKI